MTQVGSLVDQFGRVHTSLRVSVTDRCNIRCFYCMPAENVQFLPRGELLTYEEIVRFVKAAVQVGIRKLRITGGEPLVRSDVSQLIQMLSEIEPIEEVALTTNGMLLSEQAQVLKRSGLERLNISLDALREDTFRTIARRGGLERVLAGIDAAQEAGFSNIRLNALAIPGLNEDQIIPLAEFARQRQLELRFIEFMPLDAENHWQADQVLSGAHVRHLLESEFGQLSPVVRDDPSQPAVDYMYADCQSRVGFINAVTEPFCGDCNRLRLTAEGQVRNCLFSTTEWDARTILRNHGSKVEMIQLIKDCVWNKKAGHGMNAEGFVKPQRAMYQIGG